MKTTAESRKNLRVCLRDYGTAPVPHVADLLDDFDELTARFVEVERDRDELQFNFDLNVKAARRATERWRAAGPGRDMTIPDRADLYVWLLEQLQEEPKDTAALREALEFYANPETYWACSFAFDRPTGGFDNDFEEIDGRDVPGKLARAALAEAPWPVADLLVRDDGTMGAFEAKNVIAGGADEARWVTSDELRETWFDGDGVYMRPERARAWRERMLNALGYRIIEGAVETSDLADAALDAAIDLRVIARQARRGDIDHVAVALACNRIADSLDGISRSNCSASEPVRDAAVDALNAFQRQHVAAERDACADMFMGLPDRWYEDPGPKWRCVNGHVSTSYLKSEALGRPACLACGGALALTFPEDTDATQSPDGAAPERAHLTHCEPYACKYGDAEACPATRPPDGMPGEPDDSPAVHYDPEGSAKAMCLDMSSRAYTRNPHRVTCEWCRAEAAEKWTDAALPTVPGEPLARRGGEGLVEQHEEFNRDVRALVCAYDEALMAGVIPDGIHERIRAAHQTLARWVYPTRRDRKAIDTATPSEHAAPPTEDTKGTDP